MRTASSPEPPPLLLISPAGNGAGEDAKTPTSPDRERQGLGLQPSLQKLPSLSALLPLPGLSGW